MVAINLSSKIGENLIINPLMDLWQRGTSFTGVSNGDYTVDRFAYFKNGTMIHDIDRSTDVPTDSLAKFSTFINCTTAQASITAGDFAYKQQIIEGYNLRKIKGKNIFISFRVKSAKTGIHCVAFRNSANGRSYIAEYTINAADTYETKILRIKHDPTGTWDYESGSGLKVAWILAAGSTFQTTSDSWQAGNFLATANQVNVCDTINNEFRITQVQLHEGLDEIPFERLIRDFNTELELVQRYFEKSYELETALASITQDNVSKNVTTDLGGGGINVFYNVKKRILPTIVVYNPNDGATSEIYDNVARASSILSTGTDRFTITYTGNQQFIGSAHWTSDAEL